MKPTEILMQEHRVIEQVLDCLEAIVLSVEAGKELDLDSVDQSIDFFRNFADRCHHGKEEDCLFPLLEQKGFSREQGPTGVMLHEHELGRQHVRGMAEAARAWEAGSSSATNGFVAHARSFVQLLRDHIQKEDHCLFQMTDQALTEQEQSQLMESFDHVEHHDMGPGTHQKYLDIAAELAERFGVENRLPIASGSGGGCGHH
ncbi:MAG: hemerythrin domain-containing protein [Aeoliella sp.]